MGMILSFTAHKDVGSRYGYNHIPRVGLTLQLCNTYGFFFNFNEAWSDGFFHRISLTWNGKTHALRFGDKPKGLPQWLPKYEGKDHRLRSMEFRQE